MLSITKFHSVATDSIETAGMYIRQNIQSDYAFLNIYPIFYRQPRQPKCVFARDRSCHITSRTKLIHHSEIPSKTKRIQFALGHTWIISLFLYKSIFSYHGKVEIFIKRNQRSSFMDTWLVFTALFVGVFCPDPQNSKVCSSVFSNKR